MDWLKFSVLKFQFVLAIGTMFFVKVALAQHSDSSLVQDCTFKNELSIDISPLFSQVASTGILYKRHLWGKIALRSRLGGSYVQDNEDITGGIHQTTTAGFTGALGMEHAYHIGKFEFIYGLDALMKYSQVKVKETSTPSTDQTVYEMGLVPVVGLSYHPAPSIVLGIEPEAFIGTVSKSAHTESGTETSIETEIMLVKVVAFYIGLKF